MTAINSDSKAINIPDAHYVAFRSVSNGIPLGFMTPDGTTAAIRKQKDRMDGMVGTTKDAITSKTFDNKPMSGFRMGRNKAYGNHHWGRNEAVWRVQDPRGFELEISSTNFHKIVDCCTLENGEILDKCVWGRLGMQNVLIPVTSDVFKAAETNTERMGKTVSVRDIKPGYRVLTHAGEHAVFLGKLHFVMNSYENYSIQGNRVEISDKRLFVLGTQDSEGNWTKFEGFSALKLSEATATEELTLAQCESIINTAFNKGKAASGKRDHAVKLHARNLYQYNTIHGVSAQSFDIDMNGLRFEPLADKIAAEVHAKLVDRYNGSYLVEENGVWGAVWSNYHRSTHEAVKIHYDMLINKGQLVRVMSVAQNRSYYSSHSQAVGMLCSHSDATRYYAVHLDFTTPDGSKFRVYPN